MGSVYARVALTIVTAISIRAVVVAVIRVETATFAGVVAAFTEAFSALRIRGNASAITANVGAAAVGGCSANSARDAISDALAGTVARCAKRAGGDALAVLTDLALVGIADERRVAALTILRIAGARSNLADPRGVADDWRVVTLAIGGIACARASEANWRRGARNRGCTQSPSAASHVPGSVKHAGGVVHVTGALKHPLAGLQELFVQRLLSPQLVGVSTQ